MDTPVPEGVALIGSLGSGYIENVLSTHSSLEAAIADVHQRGALGNLESCQPMLGLLDHHGVPRAEAYRSVLEGAVATLLDSLRSDNVPMNKLLQLLEASFPYIKLPELSAVPLEVLGKLNPVPAAILKQISEDAELFDTLPTSVQHQVWEVNSGLLRRHAMPAMRAFTHETATTMHAHDMDVVLAPLPSSEGKQAGGRGPLPTLPRQKLRAGSRSLQTLVGMVSKSRKLYQNITKFIRLHFVEKGNTAMCTLRSQLLMALHDIGSSAELCQADTCHKLAWCLDACLRDKRVEARRLKELQTFIDSIPTMPSKQNASAKRRTSSRHKSAPDGDDSDGGGESCCNPTDALSDDLGDAGMILRDPPVLHLLLAETVRCLEGVVERKAMPKDEPMLVLLAQLLTLALSAQQIIKDRCRFLPTTSADLMKVFFPLLADAIIEREFRDSDDEEDGDSTPLNPKLVELMQKDAVIRKIALAYVLGRLAANDVPSAQPFLAVAAEALKGEALLDEAAFIISLARRLTSMVASNKLQHGSPLWDVGVEDILLRATQISTAAHEEVLRLLMAAGNNLPRDVLSRCVNYVLEKTRRQRRHEKKRKRTKQGMGSGCSESDAGYSSGGMGGWENDGASGSGGGYGSGGGGYGSGSGKETYISESAADGLRGMYQKFAQHHALKLDNNNAKALFEYLKDK